MDLIEHYKKVRFRLWNATQVAKVPEEQPPVELDQVEEKPDEEVSQEPIIPKRKIDGLSTRRSEPIFEILDKYAVSWKDVTGRSRKKKYIPVRAEVYACLYSQGLSKAHIAKICNRDHTSVLHILNTHTSHINQGVLQ
jgi:hypothetical protein